jgi:hypothetical protein
MQTVISIAIYLAANALGLLIAILILPGFRIDFLSFILVVLVFSVILAIATPLIRKAAEKWAPALTGGLSLVAIFFGLFLTNWIMAGMDMGGISNWIAATVLVWLGSVIAMLVLPRYLAKSKTGA